MIKMSKPKVAIYGAAGRMGKRLIALGQADSERERDAAAYMMQSVRLSLLRLLDHSCSAFGRIYCSR